MDIQTIEQGSQFFPADKAALLADKAPQSIQCIGNPNILKKRLLAFFCSQRTPGDIIIQTFDWVRRLRDLGHVLIGGFHSPMEKEALDLLLSGNQPLIICPARSIENMRLPRNWREPIQSGRLLVLSPFEAKYGRVTARLARLRNEFAAAMADEVFIALAAEGSNSMDLAWKCINWGKAVYSLESESNEMTFKIGAKPISHFSGYMSK